MLSTNAFKQLETRININKRFKTIRKGQRSQLTRLTIDRPVKILKLSRKNNTKTQQSTVSLHTTTRRETFEKGL